MCPRLVLLCFNLRTNERRTEKRSEPFSLIFFVKPFRLWSHFSFHQTGPGIVYSLCNSGNSCYNPGIQICWWAYQPRDQFYHRICWNEMLQKRTDSCWSKVYSRHMLANDDNATFRSHNAIEFWWLVISGSVLLLGHYLYNHRIRRLHRRIRNPQKGHRKSKNQSC